MSELPLFNGPSLHINIKVFRLFRGSGGREAPGIVPRRRRINSHGIEALTGARKNVIAPIATALSLAPATADNDTRGHGGSDGIMTLQAKSGSIVRACAGGAKASGPLLNTEILPLRPRTHVIRYTSILSNSPIFTFLLPFLDHYLSAELDRMSSRPPLSHWWAFPSLHYYRRD
jgi:hypothetical protein